MITREQLAEMRKIKDVQSPMVINLDEICDSLEKLLAVKEAAEVCLKTGSYKSLESAFDACQKDA